MEPSMDYRTRLLNHLVAYKRSVSYFAEGGLLYWTMGRPVEETTNVNRCREEDPYENHLRGGTLPRRGARINSLVHYRTRTDSGAGHCPGDQRGGPEGRDRRRCVKL